MLIPSERHTAEDLQLWSELEEADKEHALALARSGRIGRSVEAIREFSGSYCSVSWGKDSVVLAHLVTLTSPRLPMVWVKQVPLFNPDCERVRDAYCSRFTPCYEEIVIQLRKGHGDWHATGSIEAGFSEAGRRHGVRYLSGIRAGESRGRKIRMRRHGASTKNTCAPLGWWTEQDVFAYLAMHNLPVHPVYAMLGGGRWPRERIRTCRLDGRSGDGIGRAEWEREYYGDVIRRLKMVEA